MTLSVFKGLPIFRDGNKCKVVGIGKLSENPGGQFVYIKIKKEWNQNQFLKNADAYFASCNR